MSEKSMIPCPKCGQMVDKRGLRMHEDSNSCKAAARSKGGATNNSSGDYNPKCDAVGRIEHEFRLLKSNNADEAEAMQQGYTKVCIHCLELSK